MDERRRLILRQTLVYTLACIAGSMAITAGVTWLASGTLSLGLGMFIAVLAPAMLVPIGSYFHISMAARLREANEQLKALSETDPLTGTHNRRRFLEVADQQLALARRHCFPTSVLIIDFDHFKSVNDDFGHLAGDRVLVEACALIRRTLRESDTLARFGGEEFVCLLPHTAREGALLVAERIREAVRGATFHHQGQSLRVTVSIGGVTCETSETGLEKLTSKADTLLYQAKQSGRDRCTIETLPRQGALPFQDARSA